MTTALDTRITLVDVLRRGFIEKLSGRIDWQGSGRRGLFLRDGAIFLDRDGAWADRLAPAVRKASELERPWTDPEVQRAMEWLGQELAAEGGGDADAQIKDEALGGVELLGPLPSIGVLMESAVHGCDERQLIARLGGEAMRLRTNNDTPAMSQLQGLEPDMAKMFVQLENPARLSELLGGMGKSRLAALRGLTKLWAVGLVERDIVHRAAPEREELVTPKILERFRDRIGDSLESDPLQIDVESHRRQIVDLYERLSRIDHYQLFDLGLSAGDDEVLAAFQKLARKVHASHAARLGMEGREEMLRLLFERAVEGYLTLSEPRRRSSYNTIQGLHTDVVVDRATRAKETQSIARTNYRTALTAMAQMDYSTAVDLLKESVRLDPQVKYMRALAQAQSKNPKWVRHAVEIYRRALEMEPDDPGLHLGLAETLEATDRLDEARLAYQACLERMPDNPKAQSGLQRLGGRPTSAGGLRAALGKK